MAKSRVYLEPLSKMEHTKARTKNTNLKTILYLSNQIKQLTLNPFLVSIAVAAGVRATLFSFVHDSLGIPMVNLL